ncbi:hypothetical protein [Halonatronum saccharophilum]|uniref:hypothetical protein n=1 Tax=Halonatronum saccharophilum TaxID=150060 RepID=UPI0004880984|nr:hypothetical protein [Halonatronum saccharophilum]
MEIDKDKVIKFILKFYKVVLFLMAFIISGVIKVWIEMYTFEKTSLYLMSSNDLVLLLEGKLGTLLTFFISIPLILSGGYMIYKTGKFIYKIELDRNLVDVLKYSLQYIINFLGFVITGNITFAFLVYIVKNTWSFFVSVYQYII